MQRRRDPIPTFCTKVEDEMKGRLQDTEWKVRCRTVNELCDVAAMDLKCISSSTLQSLGERMKDKNVVIRKEAMTGLAQIFASHSKEKTLRWIPEFICKYFAYPEMELKLRVMTLLDDILLPKASSENERMSTLLSILPMLSSMEPVLKMWQYRREAQRTVSLYLTDRKNTTQLLKVLDYGVVSDKNKIMSALETCRDGNLFKELKLLSDCTSSRDDVLASKTAIIKIAGSKTILGLFLKGLSRTMSMSTVYVSSISTLVETLVEDDMMTKAAYTLIIRVLTIIANAFPTLLIPIL